LKMDDSKIMSNKIIKDTIFINGRFLTQSTTGVQRFALEILTALDSLLENGDDLLSRAELTCLIPDHEIEKINLRWKNIKIKRCGRLTGNLWEQIELPFFARSGLLVNLCNIGPLFHNHQVLVLHDASVYAVPQAYSFSFKLKYRIIMYVLAHASNRLVTVSDFSKHELAQYLHIDSSKITTLPEGCEHILSIEPDDTIIKRTNLTKKPFLLAVGSSSPHKNIPMLEAAIAAMPEDSIDLVIAGGVFSKVFNSVQAVESKNIKHIGYVTDGELRSLYAHATGFIFPSLYEGFGLPPLEAMSCGCPVISSNRSSMPEICGDAVLYFDPNNISEISQAVAQLTKDESLRRSLIQKGYERTRKYTWKSSAVELATIIKKIISD